MKILVISDIHNRVDTAQRLLESIDYDKAILLGDYFDNFGDYPHDARRTAFWLSQRVLTNPKIIPLIGNHDVNYFWNHHPAFRCSGYSNEKAFEVNNVLSREEINKFKFFHIEDGWVFSHAGITVPIWKDMKIIKEYKQDEQSFMEYFTEILTFWIDKTMENIPKNDPVPMLYPGWDRGGNQLHGGIIWVDWSNFASIKGINQFVGHTPHREPEVHIQYRDGSYTKKDIQDYLKKKKNCDKNRVSINFDLDTHNRHYAIITDGEVEIYDTLYNQPISEIMKYTIPESSMHNINPL